MQNRLVFVISPPRAGSTLLQRMLGSHTQIFTYPEPHLITPLAYLGLHDLVDRAPYDHINAAEALKLFVDGLPNKEADYLEALRAYSDTMYGRMLAPSGKRYFLDKTPGYALVLPFLTKLYPQAHYIVLTRHPLAVMSSYANSFFHGDWHEANAFNPVANRYVASIARMLRNPPQRMLQVGYEELVRNPALQLERIFAFLGLANEPGALEYGEHFEEVVAGSGDPIGVGEQTRPVDSSIDKWVSELADDENKLALATEIADKLDTEDLRLWGFEKSELFAPLDRAGAANDLPKRPEPKSNNYLLQRRILLALKKNIHQRPHGKLLEKVRYYCNVLLRE